MSFRSPRRLSRSSISGVRNWPVRAKFLPTHAKSYTVHYKWFDGSVRHEPCKSHNFRGNNGDGPEKKGQHSKGCYSSRCVVVQQHQNPEETNNRISSRFAFLTRSGFQPGHLVACSSTICPGACYRQWHKPRAVHLIMDMLWHLEAGGCIYTQLPNGIGLKAGAPSSQSQVVNCSQKQVDQSFGCENKYVETRRFRISVWPLPSFQFRQRPRTKEPP